MNGPSQPSIYAGRDYSTGELVRRLLGVAWLYRLATITWTVNATVTALQFTPACAVFFLLALLFGLENYQIRLGRKVSVREFFSAPSGFWPR